MFKAYSTTFIGLLTVILAQFLAPEVAGELAADVVLIVGLIVTWWGRYRIGDLTVYGKRK